jgi:ABC-type Mn2+/Zn2+ transport system ATPase subunit
VLCRDVWFAYHHEAPALEGVSFAVAPGSFTALIGPNGAGKSTLLRILLGLLRPDRGEIEIFGAPAGDRGRPIGYVPQRVKLPAGFPLTVSEVVLMGRYGRLGLLRRPGAADRALAAEALAQVGLSELAGRRFSDLSGGQQQRALIARALAGEPHLLLLDEPTAGLDPAARARFYALVCDLQHGQGLSVLCASHDLEIVSGHVDRLVLLDRAVRADGPPREVLASAALGRAYAFPVDHEHA